MNQEEIRLLVHEPFDFILAGHVDNVLINLPQALHQEGFRILVIGTPGMHLLRSPWVDAVLEIDERTQSRFIDELLERSDFLKQVSGTFLWCSDEIMREIADRDIEEFLKIRLLPVKNKTFLKILGSKIGQQSVFEALDVSTPDSRVIRLEQRCLDDLIEAKDVKLLIKSDYAGGGHFIKEVPQGESVRLGFINRDWFPILVQEFIEGELSSVEGYFVDGQLVMWLYSTFMKTTSAFGPSLVRIYKPPPGTDFIRDVEKIGSKARLQGFVNISLIWNEKERRHYIFEFDARPNLWHGAFTDLKIPFAKIWRKEFDFRYEEFISAPQKKYEPARALNRFLGQGNLLGVLRVARKSDLPNWGSPISSSLYDPTRTWELRKRILLFPIAPIRRQVLNLGILIKKKMPRPLAKKIEESRFKRWLLKLLVS